MKFEPVFLPEPPGPGASQTFLKHYDLCPRSAFLYQQHKGEAQTAAMVRGQAFHEITERSVRLMMEQEEPTVPPDVVKVITHEVLSELPVPTQEHDVIREAADRWSREFAIDPTAVIACETLFVLPLEGWEVRCRIDHAELRDDGRRVEVKDWKSSLWVPSWDEISRKRPDGTIAAKQFQLVLYALVLAYGHPALERPYEDHGPSGQLVDSGWVEEIQEGPPVASHADTFDLEYVYPMREDPEGRMMRRPMSLTRLELEEYKASLVSVLHRLTRSIETGDWPAIVSDDACGICPAPAECPIPLSARGLHGAIESPEQAALMAGWLHHSKQENATITRELKAFARKHDTEIVYGNGSKAYRFVVSKRESVKDIDALFRAVEAGGPVLREDHVRTSTSTNFKDCKVEEEA